MGHTEGQGDKLLSRTVDVGTLASWLKPFIPSAIIAPIIAVWGHYTTGWSAAAMVAVGLFTFGGIGMIFIALWLWQHNRPQAATPLSAPPQLADGTYPHLVQQTRDYYEAKLRDAATDRDGVAAQLAAAYKVLNDTTTSRDWYQSEYFALKKNDEEQKKMIDALNFNLAQFRAANATHIAELERENSKLRKENTKLKGEKGSGTYRPEG